MAPRKSSRVRSLLRPPVSHLVPKESVAPVRRSAATLTDCLALFECSLSYLRVLTSRRSLLSSSRSEVMRPSRSPASTSCRRIHRLRDSLAIPSPLAVFGIDLFEER